MYIYLRIYETIPQTIPQMQPCSQTHKEYIRSTTWTYGTDGMYMYMYNLMCIKLSMSVLKYFFFYHTRVVGP